MVRVAQQHLADALKCVVNDTRQEPELIGGRGISGYVKALANTKGD